MERIWIEGQYLALAGFDSGKKFTVQYLKDCIKISLDQNGSRTVCCKKAPLIDIQNRTIGRIFHALQKVKVFVDVGRILITKTKLQARKESALKDRSYGSVFGGGGLMDLAAELAGLHGKFTIEKNTKYADIYQLNHKAEMLNMDISEVEFTKLPAIEFLLAGIPCEPYSVARRNSDEFHMNMDLSMFFLMVVEHTNPRTIILEEVPYYLKTETGKTTMQALKRMGYNLEYRIFTGNDFGLLQVRKRTIIIASYDEIKFPKTNQRKVFAESILEKEIDSQNWFDETTKPWLFKSWKNHKAKGRGFIGKVITDESTSIPTITKRYFNIQQSNPVVKHPTEEKYRLLTENEIRKLMTVPKSYRLGNIKEHAGNVLGQGVIVKIFTKVLEAMA